MPSGKYLWSVRGRAVEAGEAGSGRRRKEGECSCVGYKPVKGEGRWAEAHYTKGLDITCKEGELLLGSKGGLASPSSEPAIVSKLCPFLSLLL